MDAFNGIQNKMTDQAAVAQKLCRNPWRQLRSTGSAASRVWCAETISFRLRALESAAAIRSDISRSPGIFANRPEALRSAVQIYELFQGEGPCRRISLREPLQQLFTLPLAPVFQLSISVPGQRYLLPAFSSNGEAVSESPLNANHGRRPPVNERDILSPHLCSVKRIRAASSASPAIGLTITAADDPLRAGHRGRDRACRSRSRLSGVRPTRGPRPGMRPAVQPFRTQMVRRTALRSSDTGLISTRQ